MDDYDSYRPRRRRQDAYDATGRSSNRPSSSSGAGSTSRMRRAAASEGASQRPRRTSSSSSASDRQVRREWEDQPTRQTAVRRSVSQQRAGTQDRRAAVSGNRAEVQPRSSSRQRDVSRQRSAAQDPRSATRTQRASTRQRDDAPRSDRQYAVRRRSSAEASASAGFKVPSKKTVIIAAIVAVVLLAVIGVASFACSVTGNLHAGVNQDLRNVLVQTDMSKEPFYLLLMGTDGSADRDEDPEYAGGQYRSDSIMLARIDVPNKKATLISIHRDTRVDLGSEYGVQKINAARAVGGPALAVQTVAKLAGVDISHYAEINFDAFQTIVDAIGGVEVDVPVDIDDSDAGGSLKAGVQTLNGEEALILCRSRNTYANAAADPDQMRAANQRLVLSAIAKKLLASDIGTIANTVRDVSKYVTTDLELNDIIGLAQAMQGLDPETDIYTAMQPAGAVYENDIWWSVTDEAEWKKMMDRVNQGLPPTAETQIDEMTGTVLATAGGEAGQTQKTAWISVKNGTPRDGLAAEAMADLNKAGFVNIAIGSANADTYRETVIVYGDPAQVYEANQIAEALGQGRVMLNDGDYIYDGNFLVLIGSDWK